MNPTPPGQRLFDLLPAIYRLRDAALAGPPPAADAPAPFGPLRALLDVIGRELGVLEAELDQLYDDQFIETCAEWVVPYIGDLLGVRALRHPPNDPTTHRGYVANTLGYRRRKGTASVLEGLAHDLTGLDSHVVEFFQLLLTTQHLNHLRPQITTVDVRQWEPLERLRTPFNTLAHTADVRRIQSRRGRFNIPNVGIFLWRVRSRPLTDSPAAVRDGRRLLFNPLGLNAPLYIRATRPAADDPNPPAAPFRAPLRLTRRVLAAHLADPTGYAPGLYGTQDGASLSVEVGGVVKAAAEVCACDLSDAGATWANLPAAGEKVVIDPVLGRIALPPGDADKPVRVTFHYGFAAEIGGGSYRRLEVTGNEVKVGSGEALKTITDGLATLSAGGTVLITDSGRYEESISIDAGANTVTVRSAPNHRPTVVLPTAMAITGAGGSVVLDGLLIAKSGLVVTGTLAALTLCHCTLVPGQEFNPAGQPLRPDVPSLVVSGGTRVTISHCITGGLRVPGSAAEVTVCDSIIDSPTSPALAEDDAGTLPAPPVTLERVTVTGTVFARELKLASDAIFLRPVKAVRRQAGCVRFSFLADGSQTPPRYECQPPTGVTAATLQPAFVSLRYGDPGYALLADRCPPEIAGGGSDEGEMGAFHELYHPVNEANLRLALDEYLRFALEAGVFHET